MISIVLFNIVSCADGETKKQLSDLNSELELTKAKLDSCSAELNEIKNTAENRFIRAKKLLIQNDLNVAKREFQGIIDNFTGTNEAVIASREIKKIENTIEGAIIEAERKKALGFKMLKPTTRVNFDGLSLNFEKIWIGKQWTFDDHGREYFLRDAQRGNMHVLVRVSITSENNNPNLPPILVYRMDNRALKLLGTLEYKFRRWKDYGSYLGNYADYGNDFAHSKTIPFNSGLELTEGDLKTGTIYIVLKKQGCFNRIKKDFGNPEIEYNEGNCAAKQNLKVEDFDMDYVLLKTL